MKEEDKNARAIRGKAEEMYLTLGGDVDGDVDVKVNAYISTLDNNYVLFADTGAKKSLVVCIDESDSSRRYVKLDRWSTDKERTKLYGIGEGELKAAIEDYLTS